MCCVCVGVTIAIEYLGETVFYYATENIGKMRKEEIEDERNNADVGIAQTAQKVSKSCMKNTVEEERKKKGKVKRLSISFDWQRMEE